MLSSNDISLLAAENIPIQQSAQRSQSNDTSLESRPETVPFQLQIC